jgi:hypothetical protein
MHSSNEYYMRALIAEKELALMRAKGKHLAVEYDALHRTHYYALNTLATISEVILSRRHQAVTRLSRLVGLPDVDPGSIRAMLIGLRTALDAMPAPGILPVAPPAEEPKLKLVTRD